MLRREISLTVSEHLLLDSNKQAALAETQILCYTTITAAHYRPAKTRVAFNTAYITTIFLSILVPYHSATS